MQSSTSARRWGVVARFGRHNPEGLRAVPHLGGRRALIAAVSAPLVLAAVIQPGAAGAAIHPAPHARALHRSGSTRLTHRGSRATSLTSATSICGQTTGKWQAVEGATFPTGQILQLTDGSVMVQQEGTGNWYRLTPDSKGCYYDGSWSALPSMPYRYQPEFYASAVLPDGRVVVEGGEYNDFAYTGTSTWTGKPTSISVSTTTPIEVNDTVADSAHPALVPGGTTVTAVSGTGPYTVTLSNAMTGGATGETLNFGAPGETDLGAIFDPTANGGSGGWTPLSPPPGWTNIGDSPATVLPDGRFMIGDSTSQSAAILDPQTLEWSTTGAGKAASNAEEGWTVLPNGDVMTGDVGGMNQRNQSRVELYDPATGRWSTTTSSPDILISGCSWNPSRGADVSVTGPGLTLNTCEQGYNQNFYTAGQTFTFDYVVTNSGTVQVYNPSVAANVIASCPEDILAPQTSEICTGTYTTTAADVAHGSFTNLGFVSASDATGGVTSSTSSLTFGYSPQSASFYQEVGAQILRPNGTVFAVGASGYNDVFNATTDTWSSSLKFDYPEIAQTGSVCPNGETTCNEQAAEVDGSAAILPDGDVLVPGGSRESSPIHYFVFNGTSLTQTAQDPPGAATASSNDTYLMDLPDGQVLDSQQGSLYLYTDTGAPSPAWAPTITSVAKTLAAGNGPYTLSGTQLNGLTQGSAFGDDAQNATNYPLVRITNDASGAVTYARTSGMTSMSVTPKLASSVNFTLPSMPTGPSTLSVVANGIASPPVAVTVTGAVVPCIPTIGTASAGNGKANVVFTVGCDGGIGISGFTVTVLDLTHTARSKTVSYAGSSLTTAETVAGLSNGDTYEFQVAAVNGVGTSPPSAVSNSVVPATPPGAPTNVGARAYDADVTVTFTPPTSDGGAPVTGYGVQAIDLTNGGGDATQGGSASPITVPGLINGDTYEFKVFAANDAAFGPYSSYSPTVVPEPVPGAPTSVGAVGDNGQATVTFAAPTDIGGSPLLGYSVQAIDLTNAAGDAIHGGSASPIIVTGLTDGDTYEFEVLASNSYGFGPYSAFSNTVVPQPVPGAPTSVVATAGNGQASVSFTTPTSIGGSPILGYSVQAIDLTNAGGTAIEGGSGSPIVVPGLVNGDTYEFEVLAANSSGFGPYSSFSNTVVPRLPTTTFAAPVTLGTGTCRSAADACSLTTALDDAVAGDTIRLVTTGNEGVAGTIYRGGFIADTFGTSTSLPVVIEPAPGVTGPILDGGGSQSVLTVGDTNLDVQGVTFQHGSSSGGGGGISNNSGGTVTVSGSTFTDNVGSIDGGAIDNGDGGSGTLTVSGSKFSGNSALADGGAIDNADGRGSGVATVSGSTFADNTALGDGGAIDSGDAGDGTLAVSDSTLVDNVALFDGGAIDNADGDGYGTATVADSTFTGNTAAESDGGAIDNADDVAGGLGWLTVTDSTFAGDSAHTGSGEIGSGDAGTTGTTTVRADLIAGSCLWDAGRWTDDGYNVGSDTSCFAGGTGDTSAAGSRLAALLGPLAANGGPTKTMALLAGNPAIGVIPDPTSGSCPVSADQRGDPSPAATACDAGAVQLEPQAIAFAPPKSGTVGGTATLSARGGVSGNPVVFTVVAASASVCRVTGTDGTTVDYLAAGACKITASQAGTANYTAAAPVTKSITIT